MRKIGDNIFGESNITSSLKEGYCKGSIDVKKLNSTKKEVQSEIIRYVSKKSKCSKSKRYWKIITCELVSNVTELVKLVRDSEGKGIKSKNVEDTKSLSEFMRKSKSQAGFVRSLKSKMGKEKEEKFELKRKVNVYIRNTINKAESYYLKMKRKLIEGEKNFDSHNGKKFEVGKGRIEIFYDKVNLRKKVLEKINERCKHKVGKVIILAEKSYESEGKKKSRDEKVELEICKELANRYILTHFPETRKEVEKRVSSQVSVIVDSFIGDNIPQRIYVAEAVERGAYLVSAQHGGWYGELEYHGDEWCERDISDIYATWGWRRHNKDRKMPSLKYIRLHERPNLGRPLGSKLLWLSKSIDRWGEYVHPSSIYEKIDMVSDGSERLERSKRMLSKIEDRIGKETVLRFDYKVLPDTSEYASELRRRISREFSPVEVDDGSLGLLERVQNAKLVLVDHVPSTVFGECVHMGVPTLLFDNIDDKALTDNAREAYHRLEDAGVLHQNAADAATKINEVFSDPLAWWTSADVQEAVQGYVDEFAYVGDEPIDEWVSFLEELVEKGNG